MARQITLVSCTAYRAENGNFGNFEAVEKNGIAFARKQCLYQKVAVGMEDTKMQSPSRCNKRTGRYGPEKNRFRAPRIGPSMQIWEFSTMSKAMVPSLHQSNVCIKR